MILEEELFGDEWQKEENEDNWFITNILLYNK